jgi:REP element-mobilizing transposase RayT
LDNRDIHERFVEFATEGANRGTWVGSYVLMPDHLHVFVVIDDERLTLSGWIKSLKNALSKILRARNVCAPHWQKDFFDHVLRSGESYSAKWDYVRNNPVRAGLVESYEEWPYLGQISDIEFRDDRV